eukprot:TRINITY_DN11847_c0_g1_i2.p1 TRINITY_DN11847_c0_g1~~TRINITY_DN11847_c0_g1_i2.p1  ORF type:complete len:172 (+),score=5.46 TRINITY_DN11847_c0_g1_i2:77-517(+)
MTQTGKDLPPPLASSFRRLLRNLARYRPYLPQSCFEDDEHGAEGSQAQCGSDGEASARSSQGPARRASPLRHRRSGAVRTPRRSRGPWFSGRASLFELRKRFESGSITSSTSSTSVPSRPQSRIGDAQGAHPPRQGGHAPQYQRRC